MGKPMWPRTMTDMWKWPMAVEEAELIITDTDTSFLKLWRTLNCPQGCKEPKTFFWFISTQNMPETCQNKLHLLITLKTRLFSPHGFTGGEALCVLAALNLPPPPQELRTFLLWHRITWVIMKEHCTKKKKLLVRFNRLLIVFEAQRSRHTGCPRCLASSIEASTAVLLSFTSTSAVQRSVYEELKWNLKFAFLASDFEEEHLLLYHFNLWTLELRL